MFYQGQPFLNLPSSFKGGVEFKDSLVASETQELLRRGTGTLTATQPARVQTRLTSGFNGY